VATLVVCQHCAQDSRPAAEMSIGLDLDWTGSGLFTYFVKFGLDPDWINGKELWRFCYYKAVFC